MNRTESARQRQASPNGKLNTSTVDDSIDEESSFPPVPYDDPSWFDPDRWEDGPAIPPNAVFYLAGRPLGPLVRTGQAEDAKTPEARPRRRKGDRHE